MDLRHVEGLAPPMREKLEGAKLSDVEALAAADAERIAEVTGLSHPAARLVRGHARDLVALKTLAGNQTPRLLALGVRSIADLADHHGTDLEQDPGIGPLIAEARERRADLRVVLRPGHDHAVVWEGDHRVTELPVSPVLEPDDAQVAIDEGERVLVIEGEAEAVIAYEGVASRAPLYEEKEDGTEVRVRVKDIAVRRDVPLVRHTLDRLRALFRKARGAPSDEAGADAEGA